MQPFGLPRGTTRLFLVAGHGSVGEQLEQRLRSLGESHWRDELTVTWWDPDAVAPAESARRQGQRRVTSETELSEECQRLTREVRARSPIVETVANGRPNEIVDVSPAGVLVHTLKSRRDGEPQLVPGWMVNVAWEHLRRVGTLEQDHLLATDGLNVKRSAFVIALLANFPGVTVESTRPTVLSFHGGRSSSSGRCEPIG